MYYSPLPRRRRVVVDSPSQPCEPCSVEWADSWRRPVGKPGGNKRRKINNESVKTRPNACCCDGKTTEVDRQLWWCEYYSESLFVYVDALLACRVSLLTCCLFITRDRSTIIHFRRGRDGQFFSVHEGCISLLRFPSKLHYHNIGKAYTTRGRDHASFVETADSDTSASC